MFSNFQHRFSPYGQHGHGSPRRRASVTNVDDLQDNFDVESTGEDIFKKEALLKRLKHYKMHRGKPIKTTLRHMDSADIERIDRELRQSRNNVDKTVDFTKMKTFTIDSNVFSFFQEN